ncbi:ATP-binding cassette domain-containing protein [Lachnospiraceae bacterium ZAX-1]
MENKNILTVQNVTKRFGKACALKDITVDIKAGRIVGLLGKNGAGKTTLIKTILELYKDFDGEIIYQGNPINTEDPKVMRTIGALVDTKFHEDLSAYDNLMMLLMASKISGSKERKHRIHEILKLVGLVDNEKDNTGWRKV